MVKYKKAEIEFPTNEAVFRCLAWVVIGDPLPWRRFENVVDSQDHLGGLRGRGQDLTFAGERLRDAQDGHVADGAVLHV